jgi:hypothetical protein
VSIDEIVQEVLESLSGHRGRPPLPPGEVLRRRSLRLSDRHWQAFLDLGGVEFLRLLLDRVIAETEKTSDKKTTGLSSDGKSEKN